MTKQEELLAFEGNRPRVSTGASKGKNSDVRQTVLRSISKPEEQLLVAKAIDSAFLCVKKQEAVFTDFLDPKSAKVVTEALSAMRGTGIIRFGGHESCERTIICFYPEELLLTVEDADFPIKTLFIDSSKFVNKLTHRDFLGAILGLGIDRRKIGDLFVKDGNAAVFVREDAADFILHTLISVGRAKVKVSELLDGFSPDEKEGTIIRATVPSMRADAILGEAFKLSRSKAAELIRSEKVFVNWEIMNSVAKEIKEGDVISMRGFGRAVVRDVCGKSKKGRTIIEIEKF